ncbi:hypothetical protein, partial [Kingella oralis]
GGGLKAGGWGMGFQAAVVVWNKGGIKPSHLGSLKMVFTAWMVLSASRRRSILFSGCLACVPNQQA